MFKIDINDKEYNIPTSFDDITMGDYVRCFRGLKDTDKLQDMELFKTVRENESIVISRLLKEDDGFCMELPIVIYEELAKACSFIYGIKSLGHKNEIVIDGVKYNIPQPEEFSLRQWIDVDVTMQEEENDGKFLDLLTILLCKRGDDGKFLPYKGVDKELRKKVEDMSARDGLGIVYHFFLRGEISRRLTSTYSKVVGVMNQFRQNTTNS